MISCTHTHSAPVTTRLLAWQDDKTIPDPDPDYLGYIKNQAVAAAAEAAENASPAEFARTTADAAGVGGNRHKIDGATDPEAGILVFRKSESQATNDKPLLAAAVI